MGYWDPEKGKPERISRNVEREYYEKFRQKEPGYYDDTEWWKLVEQADSPPAEELVECPECNAQNLQGHEICAICGHVLIGKSCINPECTRTIPRSAQSCPYCGISQSSNTGTLDFRFVKHAIQLHGIVVKVVVNCVVQ